jgi:hypothetical protein
MDGLPKLTQAAVYLALETLRDSGYLASDDGQWSSGGGFTITRIQVTGRGKQALGLWPRFEALGSPDGLAAILEGLREEVSSPRGNTRRFMIEASSRSSHSTSFSEMGRCEGWTEAGVAARSGPKAAIEARHCQPADDKQRL